MLSWTKVSDRGRMESKEGRERGERREWEGGTERVRDGGEREGEKGGKV